jgi:hypothetical protein
LAEGEEEAPEIGVEEEAVIDADSDCDADDSDHQNVVALQEGGVGEEYDGHYVCVEAAVIAVDGAEGRIVEGAAVAVVEDVDTGLGLPFAEEDDRLGVHKAVDNQRLVGRDYTVVEAEEGVVVLQAEEAGNAAAVGTDFDAAAANDHSVDPHNRSSRIMHSGPLEVAVQSTARYKYQLTVAEHAVAGLLLALPSSLNSLSARVEEEVQGVTAAAEACNSAGERKGFCSWLDSWGLDSFHEDELRWVR